MCVLCHAWVVLFSAWVGLCYAWVDLCCALVVLCQVLSRVGKLSSLPPTEDEVKPVADKPASQLCFSAFAKAFAKSGLFSDVNSRLGECIEKVLKQVFGGMACLGNVVVVVAVVLEIGS